MREEPGIKAIPSLCLRRPRVRPFATFVDISRIQKSVPGISQRRSRTARDDGIRFGLGPAMCTVAARNVARDNRLASDVTLSRLMRLSSNSTFIVVVPSPGTAANPKVSSLCVPAANVRPAGMAMAIPLSALTTSRKGRFGSVKAKAFSLPDANYLRNSK
jgi:hypothetical protein